MPNTCRFFYTAQNPGFPGISPRQTACSAEFWRTLRQRLCEPRFAASDPLEPRPMFPTADPSPLALRPREAAKALGISPRLLWQLTKEGHVPCVRVGSGKRRTVLYPIADLQTWLAQQAAAAKGGVK